MDTVTTSLWISAKVAFPAAVLVAIVGLPVAWALSRPGWRGRRLVDVIVMLPLALPPTVIGYYLLLLISRDGPIGAATDALWGSSLIFTIAAAILASGVVCFPLFVQPARAALEAVPMEVHEAAQIDGAGGWQSVRYIFLPIAWPGVWTGFLLALARALGEFGATLMVAGNIPGRTQTMPLAIYASVQAGLEREAQVLALILTAVAFAAMWIGLKWRRPNEPDDSPSYRTR